MYSISQLFVYPVKSLGGIAVAAAQLMQRGLQYDRRWMLVNMKNRFLTQREYPLMSLLQTAIENDCLVIYHKNNRNDKIAVPLHPATGTQHLVRVWDDHCEGQFVSNYADEWLSTKLSVSCRLVYMPETVQRKVDARYAHKNEITSFADDYPLLIIGQAALDDLNTRLTEPLPMDRFRPNIVFTGGQPYDEDLMEHIRISGIDMYGVKLCARCSVTTVNQNNAGRGKEPLKTLAGYRMKNNKVYFGQNILFDQTQAGVLQVGDVIRIVSKKPPIPFVVQTIASTDSYRQ